MDIERTERARRSIASGPATSASLSQSILIRSQDVTTPEFPSRPYIENIGVRPDKTEDYMTEDNLTNHGKPFVDHMLSTIMEYINSKK